MTLYLHQWILGMRQDAALHFTSSLFGRLVTSRTILNYRLMLTVLMRRNFLVAFDRAVHILVIHLPVSCRLLKTTYGVCTGIILLMTIQVMRIIVATVSITKDFGTALALFFNSTSRSGIWSSSISVLHIWIVSIVGHQKMSIDLAVILALWSMGTHKRFIWTHSLKLPYRGTLHHISFWFHLLLFLRWVFEFACMMRLGHVSCICFHVFRFSCLVFLFTLRRS